MRLLVVALLSLFHGSAMATVCTITAMDVRNADVVAVARYAGSRVFVVETILRTRGTRPTRLVRPEPEDPTITSTSGCGLPEPAPGELYVVALYPRGELDYRTYEETAYTRELTGKLHVVTAPSILDVLTAYAYGTLTRDETQEWLESAVIEPRREESFTKELLAAAEDLVNRIAISEACNKDLVRSMRTDKLPTALHAIARRLPAVDTEKEYVAQRSPTFSEDDALDQWDEILRNIEDALGPLQEELRELPWCDHEKYGW